MSYTFKDVEINYKRPLSAALRQIFGIGFVRANYICSLIGLNSFSRTGFLNDYLFLTLAFLIKQYYGTDVFLKRVRENRLKDFLAFKSFKSIKFAAGLPIRGQHTHTNAQTTKRRRYVSRWRF